MEVVLGGSALLAQFGGLVGVTQGLFAAGSAIGVGTASLLAAYGLTRSVRLGSISVQNSVVHL